MVLFVHSAGGGIKQGPSEVWTVQVLMTHMTSLLGKCTTVFLLTMKEKRCLFEHFLSAPEWERREGVGSDFNQILNVYNLLSNSWCLMSVPQGEQYHTCQTEAQSSKTTCSKPHHHRLESWLGNKIYFNFFFLNKAPLF